MAPSNGHVPVAPSGGHPWVPLVGTEASVAPSCVLRCQWLPLVGTEASVAPSCVLRCQWLPRVGTEAPVAPSCVLPYLFLSFNLGLSGSLSSSSKERPSWQLDVEWPPETLKEPNMYPRETCV